MPESSEQDQVKTWQRRVDSADKAHKSWEDKFLVELGEQYFQGLQWMAREEGAEPYVINLFYPAIKTKLPALLYYRPHFLVRPRPTRADDFGSMADLRAKLREDVLNTFVGDESIGFRKNTRRSLFEAAFRYGVVEIGYSADFIDNPKAGMPVLKEHSEEPVQDKDGSAINHPAQIIESEKLFIKRIPANTFRVPVNSHNDLDNNDWCGYYEWHYPEDIKRNKNYKNTEALQTSGRLRDDLADPDATQPDAKYRGMVKIWKIWDLRSKAKRIWAQNNDKFLLEQEFKYHPFEVLIFDERLDEFYPLPLVFNWFPPQNELNETREGQRIHRKRFKRKFTAIRARITPEELTKLEEDRDGVIAWAEAEGAVQPVTDAGLDAAVARNIPQTKDDFNEISGISSEQRGIAESETATQAGIIDVRTRVRESLQRVQVGEWLAEIGKKIILTLQDNMAMPFWVKTVVDPESLKSGIPQAFQEAAETEAVWRQLVASDLGDLEFDVSVDVESLSPITELTERQDWIQLLTILKDPQLLMALGASEPLLRKTLNYFGIRSEKDIQAVKQVAVTMLQLTLNQQQAQQQGSPTPETQPRPDIASQIQSQIGLPAQGVTQ